jgi:hypothetical protein
MKYTPSTCYKLSMVVLFTVSLTFAFGQSHPQRFILKDEGINQLSYTDTKDPSKNWYVPVPAGRDLQLVGHDCVLIGTANGYEERKIATGEKVSELTSYPGTLSAHRLRNGNTLLTGMNWQDKKGVVLVEVDKNGNKVRQIEYGGFTYLRLARETSKGTLMVAAEDTVFEGTLDGKVLWKVKVTGIPKPHVWQALRLDNGQTIISSGYAANLQIFNADGTQKDTISGPEEVHPVFYGGFQILPNGNMVVTNWQGHGPKLGTSGIQLLEYTPSGKSVWSWKQDPEKFSSIQGVIVLDGLDTKYLHMENGKGVLAPVKSIQ